MTSAEARLGDEVEAGKIKLTATGGIVESTKGDSWFVRLPSGVIVE